MADPGSLRNDSSAALRVVLDAAESYLAALDSDPVRYPGAEEAADKLRGPFPESGAGTLETIETLLGAREAAVRSSGPRYFHFVQGGTTPAALAADWITSFLDQNPAMWVASPLGGRLEVIAISWLKEMFSLPAEWGGVLTTGAQMANFTGLAAGRRWCGLKNGIDIDEVGLAGQEPVPILSSGLIHPSAVKAAGMLGIGRANVKKHSSEPSGILDLGALERELEALDGSPAILVATAGEPNAGMFDPIELMADLASHYGCWLHVDGAFGLFAALDERSRPLLKGVERADSVISDGHKWLNVPYDCGFAFVREPSLLSGAFGVGAAYLSPVEDLDHPNTAFLTPESSRRARSLAVWATLHAYGRSGYRDMVSRHLDLARRLADRVDREAALERLSDVPLNIVCFRYLRKGLDEPALNALNERLGSALLADGRIYVGTTLFEGRRALRPAIVNWRTTETDIDLLVDVILEVGDSL